MKRSKKYKKLHDLTKNVNSLSEFLEVISKNNLYSFDQSIEIKIALNRKTKNYTPYRFTITYPNPFTKQAKILVFGDEQEAKIAYDSGADYAGLHEYIDKILNENWIDYDYVLATPKVMPEIVKLGKFLGSKGLMPNPKNGTVITDIEKSVKEFKLGKQIFKEDKTNVIHTVVGKLSQDINSIKENIKKLSEALKDLSPNIQNEIKTIYIKSTMSPAIKISKKEIFEF